MTRFVLFVSPFAPLPPALLPLTLLLYCPFSLCPSAPYPRALLPLSLLIAPSVCAVSLLHYCPSASLLVCAPLPLQSVLNVAAPLPPLWAHYAPPAFGSFIVPLRMRSSRCPVSASAAVHSITTVGLQQRIKHTGNNRVQPGQRWTKPDRTSADRRTSELPASSPGANS